MVNNRLYEPEILRKIVHIKCGFSNKNTGSFRTDADIERNIHKLGLEKKTVIWMKQIHGNTINYVDDKKIGLKIEKTDGLITKTKGIFLLVRTADCIPIIACERNGKAVGVVHIGWKGIVNNILENFIKEFERIGIDRKNIVFAAGPHIQKCCYEVSSEMIQKFTNKFGLNSNIYCKKNEKFYLDLSKTLIEQFHKLKISDAAFEISKECTKSLKDKYYSFRREGKTYGENVGFIGII